jgi:hypothetical protein
LARSHLLHQGLRHLRFFASANPRRTLQPWPGGGLQITQMV